MFDPHEKKSPSVLFTFYFRIKNVFIDILLNYVLKIFLLLLGNISHFLFLCKNVKDVYNFKFQISKSLLMKISFKIETVEKQK